MSWFVSLLVLLVLQCYLHCTAADGPAVYHKRPFTPEAATKLLEPKPQTLCLCSNLIHNGCHELPAWCDAVSQVLTNVISGRGLSHRSRWVCGAASSPSLWVSNLANLTLNTQGRFGSLWMPIMPNSSYQSHQGWANLATGWLWPLSIAEIHAQPLISDKFGSLNIEHEKTLHWWTATKGKLQAVSCSLPLLGLAD